MVGLAKCYNIWCWYEFLWAYWWQRERYFDSWWKLNARIKQYQINCRKKICLSLHYNGANSYIFVNDVKFHKFKAKDSDIMVTLFYSGNVSKKILVDNMKKTGFYGYVYEFGLILMLLLLMIYYTFISIW